VKKLKEEVEEVEEEEEEEEEEVDLFYHVTRSKEFSKKKPFFFLLESRSDVTILFERREEDVEDPESEEKAG